MRRASSSASSGQVEQSSSAESALALLVELLPAQQ